VGKKGEGVVGGVLSAGAGVWREGWEEERKKLRFVCVGEREKEREREIYPF